MAREITLMRRLKNLKNNVFTIELIDVLLPHELQADKEEEKQADGSGEDEMQEDYTEPR